MSQVSILCLIPTESASLETKAAVINTTWATRCDFLQFVSDKEDPSNTLPVMLINSTGRASLWGKTKTMFSMLNESLSYDWVLKVCGELLLYLMYCIVLYILRLTQIHTLSWKTSRISSVITIVANLY